MAQPFKKFNNLAVDLCNALHDFDTDTIRFMLTATAPNVADVTVDTVETPCKLESTSNAVEVAAFSGYTKKGPSVAISAITQTGGVAKVIPTAPTVVTAGAASAAFRYAVFYNDTKGSTGEFRPAICWYDYGSEITSLLLNETFTITYDANGLFTVTVSDSA